MNSNRFRQTSLQRLVLDALFAALYVVLGSFLTFKAGIVEISVASFPVIIAAIFLGTTDAFLVALVGSFLEQVFYGLSPTAPIWMAPAVLQALFVGLILFFISRDRSTKLQKELTIVGGELILTAANTAALYLDGMIWDYPVKALNLLLPIRLLNCGVRTVLVSILVWLLLPILQKLFARNGQI